jgi:hypothetical protein
LTRRHLYIADGINNLIRQVTPSRGLSPYTITFPPFAPAAKIAFEM